MGSLKKQTALKSIYNETITHYLPHHLIQSKNNATKKIRIVYEGCAKSHKSKRSLNDCLHRGKNMVSNLCGTLLRFRLNKAALIADIEKAYLQLELQPTERDVTRFLWLKDINAPFSISNIQEYRFCRVMWGIICSSFLLACTIYVHLQQYGNDVSKDIMNNLYVDNLASGQASGSKAVTYYQKTKKIFNDASMNMCKWISNNREVMNCIGKEDRCNEIKVKILGMIWDTDLDEMSIVKTNDVMINNQLSKRTMLQIIPSVYDPMGIISLITLKFKLLIQELWRTKVCWDDEVPDDIKTEWDRIIDNLSRLHTITINRWIGLENEDKKKYELITFTDASKHEYAAVAYLRISDGISRRTNLMFSKCRLSPIKSISIPRLELIGALTGCRASNFAANELKINGIKQIVMTDSKCVLEWCNSKRELKRFVHDKVEEIRSCNMLDQRIIQLMWLVEVNVLIN